MSGTPGGEAESEEGDGIGWGRWQGCIFLLRPPGSSVAPVLPPPWEEPFGNHQLVVTTAPLAASERGLQLLLGNGAPGGLE